MTRNRRVEFKCTSLLLPIVVLSTYATAQSKSNPYACSPSVSAQMCTAENTCGSASNPCSVDVKRTANAASSTPSIPNAKGNSLFCIKPGTTVQWKSTGMLYPQAQLILDKQGQLQLDLAQNPWRLSDVLDWAGTSGVN